MTTTKNPKENKKALLEKRASQKRKKPVFVMQDEHKKPKLKATWRRPRGSGSKIRQKFKGYRKMPTQGYRSPVEVRGFSRRGFVPVRVERILDLEGINNETHAALIAKISKLSKYNIVKLCIEKNITIINMKDPKRFVVSFEEEVNQKKQQKTKEQQAKDKKKADLKEKIAKENAKKTKLAEVVAKEKEGKSEEKAEKKKIDKVLTKKE